MVQLARGLLIGGGVAILILATGYFFQLPWAIGAWPWPVGRLSYIFIASIQAAIAAAMIWIGVSKEFGALAAGALNLLVMMAGISAFLWLEAQRSGQGRLLPYAIICGAFAVANLGLLLWAHRLPIRAMQPLPRLVRWSFGAFTVLLVLIGLALILQRANIMPWPLQREASVIFGWIFFGDAFYFLYALLRPRWEYARAQLWSFLAYDLVLIVPFVAHLSTVPPELLPNLIVYIAVLLYSGLLAGYYLFADRTGRVQAAWA